MRVHVESLWAYTVIELTPVMRLVRACKGAPTPPQLANGAVHAASEQQGQGVGLTHEGMWRGEFRCTPLHREVRILPQPTIRPMKIEMARPCRPPLSLTFSMP